MIPQAAPLYAVGETDTHTDMTATGGDCASQSPPPLLDLAAELAELQAARLRRIAWRRDANAERQEARRHGLKIRHSVKLAALARAAGGSQNTPEATP